MQPSLAIALDAVSAFQGQEGVHSFGADDATRTINVYHQGELSEALRQDIIDTAGPFKVRFEELDPPVAERV